MISRLKITIFLAVLLLSPLSLHAQLPTSIDGVQISSFPELPSPGQSVSVSLESYSTDLNAASIVWIVNGKNFAQGVGMISITVTAPPLGKTATITSNIKTVEGKEVKKSLSLTSGGVDLVWESEGFVPPFYKGKSPFVYENRIRISAIPHLAGSNGVEIDPKTLLYKWTKNDKVIQDQSGYGKQTLTVQEELPRDLEILVEVSTPTGDRKASRSITLTPGDPSIIFYEEDSLYGVLYNRALANSVRLSNQEISIRAVPFGFNFSRTSPPSFNWSINNFGRDDLSTNESITLRTKEDAEGSSGISLSIRNSNNILQGAEGSINVYFSKRKVRQENNSLFQ